MPKTKVIVEQNTFVGGLITEASPLTFPNNASLDEANFILNRDGSRSRRPGMDIEAGADIIQSSVVNPSDNNLALSSFKWTNVGGIPTKSLSVVQIGPELNFFDNSSVPLSLGYIYTYLYPADRIDKRFSYAVVDGLLVVVTGQKEVDVYRYDTSNDVIIKSSKSLQVRDLFGVADVAN